jgi:hypothetical protein
VAEVELERSTANGEVGALLLDIVGSAAREVTSSVFVVATSFGIVEREVGEGHRNESEGEDTVGKHFGRVIDRFGW